MKVVILHSHYQRGGVTQVVQNQVRSLATISDIERVSLVAGPRNDGLDRQCLETRFHQHALSVQSIPCLEYDALAEPPESASDQADQIVRTLVRHLEQWECEPGQTILHWHNHSLGKNAAAVLAIHELARQGWRLLLQIHDFAEDNRPENYLHLVRRLGANSPQDLDQTLYPSQLPVHFATLTNADAKVLGRLGVPASRLHCLTNSFDLDDDSAVQPDEALSIVRQECELPSDATWCLYPVRGIRRKNVGEFLLLSRWLPEGMHAGLTLRPKTEVELRSYLRWMDLAKQVAPQAVFDAAHHDGLSFLTNLKAARFILSTSVAEGFGMAFLEPWLAARPVIARELPTVVDDFRSSGLRADGMYSHILVPGDPEWLRESRAEARAAFDSAWAQLPVQFRPPWDQDTTSDHDGTIDFARLTPKRQIAVLGRLHRDPGFEAETRSRNDDVIRQLNSPVDPTLIADNRQIVSDQYNVQRSTERLLTTYRAVLATEPSKATEVPRTSDIERAFDGSAIDLVSKVRPYFPCRTESFSCYDV
ncbi:MAG: hypothetical protein AAGA03_03525 [Planctomycetota bacterium]